MAKHYHEIRDPIHVFVRLNNYERKVLDSRPFQRLRHIHQLAMTYLVYPGATHNRFEHSLGVMELADRVFGILTAEHNIDNRVRRLLPAREEFVYWRLVLRMAALCHDIGHLPFSHAAENLLPAGWDHERITKSLILSSEMCKIWKESVPPLKPEDIVKLALGPQKAKDYAFNAWEILLSKIIVSNEFGVDRMDYLLRDSYHTGVAYGRFDHFRLIDTLRILPTLRPKSDDPTVDEEPTLGIEEGGLQSAEAMMLARYFMYSQVYFHPIRRIYDKHLIDFLRKWNKGGRFSTELEVYLAITDHEVLTAMRRADAEPIDHAHIEARRILRREHFKLVYKRNPSDVAVNPMAGQVIADSLIQKFGPDAIRHDYYSQRGGEPAFPVLMRDERIESSLETYEVLEKLPVVAVDYVFAERGIHKEAAHDVMKNRKEWIQIQSEEPENGTT